jgi:hypothetical protein
MNKTLHPLTRQRGVVLITSLLILVVMLIGAVALVRSFDVSLTNAGNIAFKRDLAQQSELISQNVIALFRSGGALNPRANRSAHDAARNYSAVVLPSNPQGIPLALLQGDTVNGGFTPGVTEVDVGRGIKLRYVVDRLCSAVGDESALGPTICTFATDFDLPGGSSSIWLRAEQGSGVAAGGAGAGIAGAVPLPVMYRLSIRADGPRGTQSFFQTTFSCCDN